ncbi:MAG: signal peptidase II [Chloroflexota bacterium]
MNKAKDYLALAGIAGFVVALDHWSKYLVRMRLAPGETWSPWEWLAAHARIVQSDNTGAAFGIFQDGALFFTLVAVLVSLAIIYYYPRVPRAQRALRLALALQLGGAIGNLMDRLLQQGRVTDIISIGKFPVFNVADAGISIGVAILLGSMLVTRSEPIEVEESLTEIEHTPS